MASVLDIEQDGHVRTIVLNRPDKMNALSTELAWGVIGAVEDAERDDDVWVVAITGSGNAFCAGLDLSGNRDQSFNPQSPLSQQLDDLSWVGQFFLTLRQKCDKPIVAGINGAAVGAGLSLAMAADMRIVAESARLIAGYPRIGGSPDGGLSYTLRECMGHEQAMRFLLENRTVGGVEAVHLGMAGELVEDDKLRSRLAEYCHSLTQLSPVTGRLTKRTVVKAATTTDLETHLRYELATIHRAFASEDAQECRKAFLEKRAPVIKGR